MRHHLHLAMALPGILAVSCLAREAATQGRLKWRYQAAAPYFSIRPALAKDGTIYAVDVLGTLHAIAPNGTGKWTLAAAGRRAVDVAGDGTIYAGEEGMIRAIRPDGSVKWTYVISPRGYTMTGPTVGPDGNIYANAAGGKGMFSLTPAGQLRWATPTRTGRPRVQSQEVVFRPAAPGRNLQAIYSGSGELAQVDTTNGKLTLVSSGPASQPVVGPNGDLYSGGSMDLRAFRPDGTLRWKVSASRQFGIGHPAVGTDGVVYVVKEMGLLLALRPTDGSTIWGHHDFSTMHLPMTSPTNHMVLVAGNTEAFTDFLRAVDVSGRLLWQFDFPRTPTTRIAANTTARFTPDGATAYVGAWYDNRTCYLYAFDTSSAPIAGTWTWGKACPGISAKLPLLSFAGRPVLGSSFATRVAEARASSTAVHVVGLLRTRVDFTWNGAPDCLAYVTPDLLLTVPTDATGQASSTLAVPNVPALAGLQVFHQFAVADPVNRLGIVSTEGGASLLGR